MFRRPSPRRELGLSFALCASAGTELGGKPFCFLVGVVAVMTRHTRCVVASPDPSIRQRRVGALTYSSSNRASNGIQVDQGVARKAK
jgi:hypothetical protein